MHRDLLIVGAGPIGATLGLALREADLFYTVLDAREYGESGRSDRTLALSHGTRLIFERLGIWGALTHADSPTAISCIDISQRSGGEHIRLSADELELPALGYVVSYRALQQTLDSALRDASVSIQYGSAVQKIGSTSAYAMAELKNGSIYTADMLAVADGGEGKLPGIDHYQYDYQQCALVAKLRLASPVAGLAIERFTADGPLALLPYKDEYALVWTASPERTQALLDLSTEQFLTELAQHYGEPMGCIEVRERRVFPLTLRYARSITAQRLVVLGNAAQALHPVAGLGFNLGVRDAWELADLLLDTGQVSTSALLARYAEKRRWDRRAGTVFTHSLLKLFMLPDFFSLPRSLGLQIFAALPSFKRAFMRAALFGLH